MIEMDESEVHSHKERNTHTMSREGPTMAIRPVGAHKVKVERLWDPEAAAAPGALEAALWGELREVLTALRQERQRSPDEELLERAMISGILASIPPRPSDRHDVLRRVREWYRSSLARIGSGVRSPRGFDRAFVLRNLLNDLAWIDETAPSRRPLEVLFIREAAADRVIAAATYGIDPSTSPGPHHRVPYVHNLWSRRPGLGRELLFAARDLTGSDVLYLRPLNEGVRRYYRDAFGGMDLKE